MNKQAITCLHGTGERTLYMSEQFAFEQFRCDGAAVNRDKRATSFAAGMNGPRKQFLTCPGLALNENSRLCGCNALRDGQRLDNRIAVSNDTLITFQLIKLQAQ